MAEGKEDLETCGIGGTGIDAVDADVAPVYFDITGKQIDAPARGLYIKKVGDKITKEYVRWLNINIE